MRQQPLRHSFTAALGPLFTIVALACLADFARANVVGADTQNFNPTTSGLDFVTVHSSETLRPGIFNTGLFLNYATNTLPNLSNQQTQSFTDVRDTLLSLDFHLGVGILKGWDAGISLPQILRQTIDDGNPVPNARYSQTGMTEVKLNTKVRLLGDDSGGFAGLLSINFPLIENNPFTGVGAGPTLNAELAADTTVGKVALGANVGYRFRSPGEQNENFPGIQPYGDQFIASIASSYLIENIDTKIIGEIFGAVPTEDTQFISDREVSTLEALLGLKWDVNTALAAHFGVGTGLMHGTASPDFRIYTGLNYTFGPLWGNSSDYDYRANEEYVEETIVEEETVEPAPAPRKKEQSYYVIDNNSQVFDKEPAAPVETFVARDILFEFDSAEVKRDFYPVLAKLANYLKKGNGFTRLEIAGHTDSIGSNEYNRSLSYRRANSVRSLLLRVTDIPQQKIIARGYGESQPIADNGNYQGRQLNRRVEFKIFRNMR